eukprot:TRINITY_DN4108_c0_g1_i3.p1 TRINITY_DN4108_c0_g1~~TRINITY_DN4108_c0_g1_i3.p1  ORF type:complete len:508 (+),score=152.35 TRINITY_DN4108_c0_g1_i3:1433-2956(+)
MVDSNEANFDVETAIKVCRQAGYYDKALSLSKQFQQHDWYLKIQIEDQKNFKEAVNYIQTLPFAEAENNVKKYGKTLMTEQPDITTELLTRMCTNYAAAPVAPAAPSAPGGAPAAAAGILDEPQGPSVEKANPEEYIHLFVEQPFYLTQFLEYITTHCLNASQLLYDTLLELYLQDPAGAASYHSDPGSEERLKKAEDLLKFSWHSYNPDHALVLCKTHCFTKGVLLLLEKLNLYHDILQHHMENKDYLQILDACEKYGEKEPNLWMQALSYFSCRDDCQDYITTVLSKLDNSTLDNLIPPTQVIEILAQRPATKLSVVRDYIARRLQQENALIQEDAADIKKLRKSAEEMRAELEELRKGPVKFQQSKCSACSRTLDLPAIHFLCKHSFHQSCAENEDECPVCADDNRETLERLRSRAENATLNDPFFHQIEKTSDGFGAIAEYFGHGIFQPNLFMQHEDSAAGAGGVAAASAAAAQASARARVVSAASQGVAAASAAPRSTNPFV